MSEGWTLGGNARREELFMRSYAEDGARRVDVEPRSNRRSEDLAGCIDHMRRIFMCIQGTFKINIQPNCDF